MYIHIYIYVYIDVYIYIYIYIYIHTTAPGQRGFPQTFSKAQSLYPMVRISRKCRSLSMSELFHLVLACCPKLGLDRSMIEGQTWVATGQVPMQTNKGRSDTTKADQGAMRSGERKPTPSTPLLA